jgi:hypothetical protein
MQELMVSDDCESRRRPPRHPGPDPGSSGAMSIARETLMRAPPVRRKGGPLTAQTRGGWMPDQVRHDGNAGVRRW